MLSISRKSASTSAKCRVLFAGHTMQWPVVSREREGVHRCRGIFGWSSSSGDASWRWLVRILAHETNSPLADEIQWPDAKERAAQRELLAKIGINEVYLAVVAWVDGVKQ